MSTQVERLVTAGNHDPAGPPVHENNVWIVGDDVRVVVIDPAHDARAGRAHHNRAVDPARDDVPAADCAGGGRGVRGRR